MEVLIFFFIAWVVIQYSKASEAKKKEYRAKAHAAYMKLREEAQKNARNSNSSNTNSWLDLQRSRSSLSRTPSEATNTRNKPQTYSAKPSYNHFRPSKEQSVQRYNDTPTVVRPRKFWGDADYD